MPTSRRQAQSQGHAEGDLAAEGGSLRGTCRDQSTQAQCFPCALGGPARRMSPRRQVWQPSTDTSHRMIFRPAPAQVVHSVQDKEPSGHVRTAISPTACQHRCNTLLHSCGQLRQQPVYGKE